MRTVIATAEGVLAAPAERYAERLEPLAAGNLASREIPRVAAALSADAVAGAGLERGLRRVLTALGSFGEILVLAYAFPVAILAIGIPIALFVRLMMWIIRAVVV